MSLSVMSPAPSSRTLSRTSSWSSCSSAWVIAPSEPGHVGLEDDPQLLGLAGLDLAVEVLERRAAAAVAGPCRPPRPCGSRPWCGLPSRRRRRAGCRRRPGTSARPRMTTALDGPAFVTRLPLSFSSARTRPNVSPTTMMSPTLSVPVWTSAVATGPRPLSSCASTIVPIARALRVGLELLEVGDEQDHLDQLVEARRGSWPRPARAARRRRTPRRRCRPR